MLSERCRSPEFCFTELLFGRDEGFERLPLLGVQLAEIVEQEVQPQRTAPGTAHFIRTGRRP